MMRPLLLCLLFLGLTAPPASAQDDPAQANLVHARQAYDSGSWEKALGLYADIYASPQSTPTQKAEAALEWSSILWEQGDYTTARARAEEALTLAKKERLDAAAGRLLLTIGHIEAAQGQFSRANSTLKACVTLAGELDDPVFGALCKMNLSLIAKIQGKQGMSDAQLRAAIKNLERAGTPLATGSALAKTGELLAKNGDHTQAMLLLERAQGVFEAAGSVPAAARNRLRIARQLQDQGQFDRAKVHINLALPKLQAMGNRPLLVTTYGLQGKDAERLGDLAGARGSYAKSLSLANAIGSPQLRAQSHLALCELGTKGPHLADLEHHCTQAATTFASLRVPDLQARALIVLGQVYQSHAQYQAAQTTYKQAITLLESTDPKANALSIATQRANLCQVEHAMNVTGTLLTCKRPSLHSPPSLLRTPCSPTSPPPPTSQALPPRRKNASKNPSPTSPKPTPLPWRPTPQTASAPSTPSCASASSTPPPSKAAPRRWPPLTRAWP